MDSDDAAYVTAAQQVSSPVPDFSVALQAVLEFIGVSPFLICAILLAFAVESWYANGKRMTRAAVAVTGVVTGASTWLGGQLPVRIVVAVVTTMTVVTAQILMVRISYVGGSIVATPFDPERSKVLFDAWVTSPLLFVDTEFLDQIVATDTISVSYVSVTVVAMLYAYRKKVSTIALWLLATTPFWIILVGNLFWATLGLAFDLLFAFFSMLGGVAYEWTFTADYILAAPKVTAFLVAGIYCGVALVAIGGAAVVRRLWSATAVQPIDRPNSVS